MSMVCEECGRPLRPWCEEHERAYCPHPCPRHAEASVAALEARVQLLTEANTNANALYGELADELAGEKALVTALTAERDQWKQAATNWKGWGDSVMKNLESFKEAIWAAVPLKYQVWSEGPVQYIQHLTARLAQCQEALRTYGRHLDWPPCEVYADKRPCTCGLDAVLSATKDNKVDHPRKKR